MANISKRNSVFFSSLGLKKKYQYFKKVNKSVLDLKDLIHEKKNYKNVNSLMLKKNFSFSNKVDGLVVVYIIFFSFTSTNTFLHVTDALGNLKLGLTAGLIDFKGKQKKSRLLVLNRFFRELKKLKVSTLKSRPIALHLGNVGFYRYYIIKNLKKDYFVRFVKSYETYSYNGCRKRKKLRKR